MSVAQIHPGTYDQNSTTVLVLDPRPVGRYLRLNPQAWEGHVAMRFEIIGCLETEQHYCECALASIM